MKRPVFGVIGAVLAAILTLSAAAQMPGGDRGRRDSPSAVNPAPPPALFTVVSVDEYARNLSLQAADGRRQTVLVPEGVYELSRLKPGDRVRVDFIVPDAANPQPAAAAIWPAGQ